MIKITAKTGEASVDVQTEINGRGGDVIAEATSIVKALYEGFESNEDMGNGFCCNCW